MWFNKIFGGGKTSNDRSGSDSNQQALSDLCHEYPLTELKEATDNFNDKYRVGNGLQGKVFKGVLDNGAEVAIKNVENVTNFEREIRVVAAKCRHPNLAMLMGWAKDDGNKIMYLVYELIIGEELNKCLHMSPHIIITWPSRINIVLNVAQGLAHMHACRCYHRDIKSSNILLTADGKAKLVDFGLTASANDDGVVIAQSAEGTAGYACPTYVRTRIVSERTETFALGALMLELLINRMPARPQSNGHWEILTDQKAISVDRNVEYVEQLIKQNQQQSQNNQILSPVNSEWDPTFKREFMELMFDCLSSDVKKRPVVNEVMRSLRRMYFNVVNFVNDLVARNLPAPYIPASQVPLYVFQQMMSATGSHPPHHVGISNNNNNNNSNHQHSGFMHSSHGTGVHHASNHSNSGYSLHHNGQPQQQYNSSNQIGSSSSQLLVGSAQQVSPGVFGTMGSSSSSQHHSHHLSQQQVHYASSSYNQQNTNNNTANAAGNLSVHNNNNGATSTIHSSNNVLLNTNNTNITTTTTPNNNIPIVMFHTGPTSSTSLGYQEQLQQQQQSHHHFSTSPIPSQQSQQFLHHHQQQQQQQTLPVVHFHPFTTNGHHTNHNMAAAANNVGTSSISSVNSSSIQRATPGDFRSDPVSVHLNNYHLHNNNNNNSKLSGSNGIQNIPPPQLQQVQVYNNNNNTGSLNLKTNSNNNGNNNILMSSNSLQNQRMMPTVSTNNNNQLLSPTQNSPQIDINNNNINNTNYNNDIQQSSPSAHHQQSARILNSQLVGGNGNGGIETSISSSSAFSSTPLPPLSSRLNSTQQQQQQHQTNIDSKNFHSLQHNSLLSNNNNNVVKGNHLTSSNIVVSTSPSSNTNTNTNNNNNNNANQVLQQRRMSHSSVQSPSSFGVIPITVNTNTNTNINNGDINNKDTETANNISSSTAKHVTTASSATVVAQHSASNSNSQQPQSGGKGPSSLSRQSYYFDAISTLIPYQGHPLDFCFTLTAGGERADAVPDHLKHLRVMPVLYAEQRLITLASFLIDQVEFGDTRETLVPYVSLPRSALLPSVHLGREHYWFLSKLEAYLSSSGEDDKNWYGTISRKHFEIRIIPGLLPGARTAKGALLSSSILKKLVDENGNEIPIENLDGILPPLDVASNPGTVSQTTFHTLKPLEFALPPEDSVVAMFPPGHPLETIFYFRFKLCMSAANNSLSLTSLLPASRQPNDGSVLCLSNAVPHEVIDSLSANAMKSVLKQKEHKTVQIDQGLVDITPFFRISFPEVRPPKSDNNNNNNNNNQKNSNRKHLHLDFTMSWPGARLVTLKEAAGIASQKRDSSIKAAQNLIEKRRQVTQRKAKKDLVIDQQNKSDVSNNLVADRNEEILPATASMNPSQSSPSVVIIAANNSATTREQVNGSAGLKNEPEVEREQQVQFLTQQMQTTASPNSSSFVLRGTDPFDDSNTDNNNTDTNKKSLPLSSNQLSSGGIGIINIPNTSAAATTTTHSLKGVAIGGKAGFHHPTSHPEVVLMPKAARDDLDDDEDLEGSSSVVAVEDIHEGVIASHVEAPIPAVISMMVVSEVNNDISPSLSNANLDNNNVNPLVDKNNINSAQIHSSHVDDDQSNHTEQDLMQGEDLELLVEESNNSMSFNANHNKSGHHTSFAAGMAANGIIPGDKDS